MHTAFIGLGSNLSDPQEQVMHALQALDSLPQTSLMKRSSLYRSAPVGYLQQPDFINAVAQVATGLSPRELLNALLVLEKSFGRTREFINAPRTLDLDILLYDDLRYHEDGLTVPHPRMHCRAFVLQPLIEIAPDCVIPGLGSARQALQQCSAQKTERLEHAIE
jgi:2-amino-4-hydroxy-6-hydroxymethyldihydropteridine diphosphokinase